MNLPLVAALLGLLSVCTSAWAGSEAESLLRRGALDEALASASEAAREAPHDVDAQELVIDLLLSAGLSQRARHEAEARVRVRPEDPDAHYLLGRALVDAREARDAYETALRLDADHARSHMGIAAVHTALGDASDAAAAYKRAASLDPGLEEAWLGLVRSLVALGETLEAAKMARLATVHVPSEPGVWLALASLHVDGGADVLEEGVTQAEPDARLLAAVAEARLKRGDGKGARDAARAALELDPSLQPAILVELYASELAGGRIDRAGYEALLASRKAEGAAALAKLDGLVSRYPNSPLVRMTRSEVRKGAGDVRAAISDLSEAQLLDPAHTEANIAMGQVLLEQGRPQEAKTHLVRAYDKRPWSSELGLALGTALLQAESADDAARVLIGLVQANPYDVRVVGTAAQALVQAGHAEDAYLLVRQVVGTMPDPRLVAVYVMVAAEAGHHEEAARVVDQVAAETGSERMEQLAAQLRAMAISPAE